MWIYSKIRWFIYLIQFSLKLKKTEKTEKVIIFIMTFEKGQPKKHNNNSCKEEGKGNCTVLFLGLIRQIEDKIRLYVNNSYTVVRAYSPDHKTVACLHLSDIFYQLAIFYVCKADGGK